MKRFAKWFLPVVLLLVSNVGRAQTTQSSLLVTRIYNITSSWAGECGAGVVDNRSSVSRQNNYHSIYATGAGSWTVEINYSDVSCSGPWSSFGSASQVTQASNPAIAYANGYHPYIQIAVTGAATVRYTAAKDFFLSTSVGSLTFPITVGQGGTNATTAAGARSSLGAAASGANADILSLGGLTTPLSVAQGGTGVTAAQGNGSKVQRSTGSPTSGNCAKFDSNGNTADSGGPCTAFPSGSQLQYLRIQPNTGNNTTTEFANFPAVNAPDYNFAALSPSGSITGGVNVTITLTPVPLGVNWYDAPGGISNAHKVWVAGTGTPQACSIITAGPGTALSGAATGTLTVNCAGSHAAGFTVEPASDGVQEAGIAAVAAGSATVYAPDGSYHLLAPVVLPSGVGIRGSSSQGTTFYQDFATGHALTVTGPGLVEVSNLNFISSVTVGSGYFYLNAVSVAVNVHDCQFDTGYGHILFDAVSRGWASNIHMVRHTVGIQLGGTTGASGLVASNILAATDKINAVSLNLVWGLIDLSNFNFQDSSPSGSSSHIIISPGATQGVGESTITNGTFDGGWAYSIRFLPNAAAGCFGFTFSNLMFTGGSNPDHGGIATAATCLNMQYSNIQMRGVGSSTNPPVQVIGGTDVSFNQLTIADYLGAGVTGIQVGVGGNVVKGFSLTNSRIGYTSAGAQDPNSDVAVDYRATANTDVLQSGNTLYGSTSMLANLPTVMTRWMIAPDLGLDNITPAVASAATLAFPATGNPNLTVTGSTPATAVSGLWAGKSGTITATDATLKITAGATIGNSFILRQNVPARYWFDGTKAWFTGQDPGLSNSYNYIATEGGANNAITGTLAGVTTGDGLCVTIQLAHTLQAGANTFALNGGAAVDIKKHTNAASNLGTAYANTGRPTFCYNSTGPAWMDMGQ